MNRLLTKEPPMVVLDLRTAPISASGQERPSQDIFDLLFPPPSPLDLLFPLP
jgi:hypothetical protein